jgi:Domain of unknown function (DUF222)
VALARRDSSARGGRHLGFATALVFEMPHTLAALECGVLSEWRATLIVKESACLTVEDRRALDAELCADVGKLDGLGDARITANAKAIAYRLDPQSVVDRAAKAEFERTVTIRPAPDSMAYVTILLPVATPRLWVALRRSGAAELIDGGTDDVVCHGHRPAQIVVDQLDGIRGKVAAVLDLARPVTLSKQLLRAEGGVLGRQPLQVSCFVGLSRRCDHHGERRHRRHSGDQDAKWLNHDLPPPGETVWLSYPEWA